MGNNIFYVKEYSNASAYYPWDILKFKETRVILLMYSELLWLNTQVMCYNWIYTHVSIICQDPVDS